MPLFDDAGAIPSAQLTRPGQLDSTGAVDATAVVEYSDQVQHTIERRSAISGLIPMRSVRGTNQTGNFGFGKSTVGAVTPGEAPAATKNDVGRVILKVDTLVYTRHAMPLLETFQTSYDARIELGIEDGTEMAKFIDQAFFIQAAKASLLGDSAYSSVANKPVGWSGGSTVTLAASGDATDPAKLYQSFSDLFVQMENKDVIPRMDDIIIAVRPAQFYALQDAEQIVNGNYVTARGTQLDNVAILKAFGCPVVSSNNVPNSNVSGHLLSNAGNSNAYDGDFTKLVGIAFSAKALLAGETIALESDVFYDKIYKSWFVDSHTSFGVTPDRAEYAGSIWLP